MSTLSPSDAAMVRWRVEDMQPEAAARELCESLGLGSEVQRLIEAMLWEAEEQGLADGKHKAESEMDRLEVEAREDGREDEKDRLVEIARVAAARPGATAQSVLGELENA